MQALIWAGWLMVAVGAAMLAGSIAAGSALFGVLTPPAMAGSGVFMIVLASGWDKPLGSPEELHRYARPAPGRGETVTIKFDPHKRREFVLVEDGYEVTDQVQQTLAALRA